MRSQNYRIAARRYSPYRWGIVLWTFVLFLSGGALLWSGLIWPLSLLAALQCAALALMFFDKTAAQMQDRRIPEVILLSALALGPAGGLLGMQLFRHKTKKTSFQFWVFLILLAEIALAFYVFREGLPSLFSAEEMLVPDSYSL